MKTKTINIFLLLNISGSFHFFVKLLGEVHQSLHGLEGTGYSWFRVWGTGYMVSKVPGIWFREYESYMVSMVQGMGS